MRPGGAPGEFKGNEGVDQRADKKPFREGDLSTEVGKTQARTAFQWNGAGEDLTGTGR